MKVKLFTEEKPEKLEAKLNQWLQDNSWVKVEQITQSGGTLLCIAIWYREPDVPLLG